MKKFSENKAALPLVIIIVLASAFTVHAMILYPELHNEIFRVVLVTAVLFVVLLRRFEKKRNDEPVIEPEDKLAVGDENDDVNGEFDDLGMTEFWWE